MNNNGNQDRMYDPDGSAGIYGVLKYSQVG